MRAVIRDLSAAKKVFSAILVLGFVCGIVCPLYPESIILLHSNDTHGIFKPYKIRIKDSEKWVGGMETASHYINEIKSEEENVLLIDLGDIMTGTLAAEIEYRGVAGGAMIEFLNRLNYDIWCYGNHDFDKGQPHVLELSRLAKFPTVMANIVYKENGKLFPAEPYHIFEIGGLKVGVIAVMWETFLIEVLKEKIKGLDILPIIPVLQAYIPLLDKQTDLIVVLVHGWFDEGLRVAKNVAGIDVVLVASEDGKFEDVNGVLVKSTRGHQRTLGFLRLEVENDKVKSYEEKLIWLWPDLDLKQSTEVSALVEEVDASIKKEYTKVIGEAKVELPLRNYSIKDAPVENALGNWITDVMRWKTGAQIGLHNDGGIRSDIKAGPITKADIFNVCPFYNTLVVIKLTGKQLKDALEYDVERGWDRLQVSGLKYKYYPKESKTYGERVDYVEINGEVLVKEGNILLPKKVYTIVTNDYIVGHAEDKYFGFPVASPRDSGFHLREILIEWLDEHKVLDYKFEKRIVEISK